jgi:hypothetical protein
MSFVLLPVDNKLPEFLIRFDLLFQQFNQWPFCWGLLQVDLLLVDFDHSFLKGC